MVYIDAGVCPRCGSHWTGRLIEKRSNIRRMSLFGPVIYTSDKGLYTCACAACGVRWEGIPKTKWVPIKRFFSLRSEFYEDIDGSSPYSYKEESEIAKSMYNEMMGIKEDDKPVKKNGFIARAAKREAKALMTQAGNTASDFAGIFGLHLPQKDDELDDEEIFQEKDF